MSSIQEINHNGACVQFRENEEQQVMEIFSLRVAQKKRRQGLARAAMDLMTARADALGYAMKLDASPLDNRVSTEGLVAFYRQYGFECTGKTVNPVGDPEMRRPAATTPSIKHAI
jgi:ribosomal protein S18 acetylase RimI-like enzyme